MASLSKKTEAKRANRRKGMGKDRKRKLRAEGTTPAFPIHQEGKAKTETKSE